MMKRLMLAQGTVLLLLAGSVSGSVIPVNLGLVPPAGPTNTLGLTLTASAVSTVSDTDTSTLTGNLLANLSIDFHPTTLEADVTGLEFTGGDIDCSEVSFTLYFGPLGTLQAAGTGIGGTLDTPTPPGAVTGGTFAGSDHVVILNQGTLDCLGTGTIGTMVAPFTVELSTYPVLIVTNQPGSVAVSAPNTAGGQATYDVTLVQPVDFEQELYNDGSAVVTIAGEGMIEAQGQFSIPVPEPGTLALLALGALVLARRRRRAARML